MLELKCLLQFPCKHWYK